MKHATIALLVLLAFAVPPESADLGMTMTMSMNAGGMAINATMETRVKALKMRADIKVMQQDMSIFFDAAARQVFTVNHVTKEITNTDIQLSQQHETVFATMYVYRPDGSPDFYVAVLDPASAVAWSGLVYHTSGPWFGGPFNPASVTENVVGSMTFTLKSFYNAELAYTIDVTQVVKTVTRFSFANDHVGGNYSGAATATTLSGKLPLDRAGAGRLQFTHAGGVPFTGVVATAASTCTMTGSYGQRGRYGDVFGNYTHGRDSKSGAGSFVESKKMILVK